MLNLRQVTEGQGEIFTGSVFDADLVLDRQKSSNALIEAIIQTIANICQATRSNHSKLISMGLIEVVKTVLLNYCPYAYLSPVRQPSDHIDATELTIGNVKLLQSLSNIIQSLSKNVDVQETAIQNDLVSVIKHCARLKEYEVHTNLHLSLGNLVLSQFPYVR